MKKLLFFLFLILCFIYLPQWAQGQNNVTLLEFDGDDSFFVNDNADVLDVSGDWTWEFWVYPTAASIPAAGVFPSIICRKYTLDIYFRRISSSTLSIGVIALDGGSSDGFTEEAVMTTDTVLLLDKWTHIAISSTVVSSTRTTRMFFNGKLKKSSTDADFALDASISAYNFGARYSDPTYSRYVSDCAMDELRFSKVARYTSNFSIDVYDSPLVSDANTILLYHLDESTGTSISNDGSAVFNTNLRSSPNTATWRAWNYFSHYLPLPLKMLWFTVEEENHNTLLKWLVAEESNVQGYYIERSTDLKQWNDIGFVEALNNTSQNSLYSFTDPFPVSLAYYRLRSTDFDGTENYSEIQILNRGNDFFLELYPNPAEDVLNLISTYPEQSFDIKIFNSFGEAVKLAQLNNTTINVSDLSPGLYYLQIFMAPNTFYTYKFIKK